MKRTLLLLAGLWLLAAGGTGCRTHFGSHPCHNPTSVSAQPQGGAAAGDHGTGQITYPYYTTRGPRDFLQAEPYDIGY